MIVYKFVHNVYACSFSVVSFCFSRAHTIVSITFIQKSENEAGEEMAKTSVVNLVDLAGRYGVDNILMA